MNLLHRRSLHAYSLLFLSPSEWLGCSHLPYLTLNLTLILTYTLLLRLRMSQSYESFQSFLSIHFLLLLSPHLMSHFFIFDLPPGPAFYPPLQKVTSLLPMYSVWASFCVWNWRRLSRRTRALQKGGS